jgi:hypothetical protein
MQEILGTELEVGQEYYVMKQEKNPLNSVDGQWETRVKYSGTYTGRIFYKYLNFIVTQKFFGNLLPGKQHEPISYNTPSRAFENFRTIFYKKTDTPKNQEMRDNRQQREALTQMFGKLPMHQYYDNDGQSQFARGPDGKPYFPPGGGGRRKRTLRRASKSKKRRSAARSKKRRARANKHKKTRRTKRY